MGAIQAGTALTAITCPEHEDCRAELVTRPGRVKTIGGPRWLQGWLDEHDVALVGAVHHSEGKLLDDRRQEPCALHGPSCTVEVTQAHLPGGTRDWPRDSVARARASLMQEAPKLTPEGQSARLAAVTSYVDELAGFLGGLPEQVERFGHERRELAAERSANFADLYQSVDTLAELFAECLGRIDKLEQFALRTRRSRWAWRRKEK